MTDVFEPEEKALTALHIFKNEAEFKANVAAIEESEMALVGNVEIIKVGGIYMSTKPDNPATLFGGKWQALNEGRVLVSAGSRYTLGSKGGSKTVSLSENHLPRHNHSVSLSSAGSHSHWCGYGERGWSDQYYVPGNRDTRTNGPSARSSTGGAHSHTLSCSYLGGSSPHNNMMPYMAVYMWQRTE